MDLKRRVKISFFIIVILVFFVGITSVLVTYTIRQNSLLNNKISQIIFLQERMNQAIQDIDRSDTIIKIDLLKHKFNSYELSFEKIRETISLNNKFSFLDNKQNIMSDLQQLYENEHTIELTFDKMYKLQESYIETLNSFNEKYPEENSMRSKLYKQILALQNHQITNSFGQVRYYSKETLYQKPSKQTLKKWLSYINDTIQSISNQALHTNLQNYKQIVQQIGQHAIILDEIKTQKNDLQKKINTVLVNNKKLASHVSNTIIETSTNITNVLYTILIILIAAIVLFIIIFSYKVSQHIGLSVSQIEEKVQEGLKQITQLNTEIENTQKEVVFTMGTIAEYRSKETGNHVKRVAHYSKILATHYGLNEEEAEMLKQASPMHDIGKVAIPDAVLNKPGRFNEEERKIVDTHAFLGYQMLNKSDKKLLKAASIVAHEHHEKWDGSGYPRGLSGENIHIYGRITAIADVFDALGSDRVYKKAWDNERIFKLFKEERGKHFEPKLIDIFFDNLDEFLTVQRTFKDV